MELLWFKLEHLKRKKLKNIPKTGEHYARKVKKMRLFSV